MSQKAAIRASSFIHSRLGVSPPDGECAPLLRGSFEYSQESGLQDTVPDLTDGEYVAFVVRPEQDKMFREEHAVRMNDLASSQLLHDSGLRAQKARVQRKPVAQHKTFVRENPDCHRVQVQGPVSNVAEPQNASICFASDESNSSQPPATHRQQTGIIREYILRANRSEVEGIGSSSRSSSLQRQGAVRSKTNPLVVKKKDDGDEGDGCGSNSSSLRRSGALRHKDNPIFSCPTFEDFDHLRCPW